MTGEHVDENVHLAALLGSFDAYFRSSNGVPPNARIQVPSAEWAVLHAALKGRLEELEEAVMEADKFIRDKGISYEPRMHLWLDVMPK